MSGLNTLLDIGKSGLFAAQTSITTTGNNIANVNTPGYRRQSVRLEEAYPFYTTPGEIGTGVHTKEVVRHFDKFIEGHFLDKSAQQKKWNALHDELRSVESLVNETTASGISSSLTAFFKDWQDLSVHPDAMSSRTALLGHAQALLGSLRTAATDMINQKEQIDLEVENEVKVVNGLLRDIARLNDEIQSQDIPGSRNANSLYDERDKLVRELATKMDIHCIDNGGGNYSVQTSSGQTLVHGVHHFRLSFEEPQVLNELTAGSTFDGELVFKGDSRHEYLVQVVQGGPIGTARYKVSVDNGKTWLKDKDGNSEFTTSTDFFKLPGREIQLSFRQGPGGEPLSADDSFVVVPKKGLFWIKNASVKEHITPLSDQNELNHRRLQGGELCGKLQYRDAYLGDYQDRLDSFTRSLIWQVNTIHSQGMGLNKVTDMRGTYAVDNSALTSSLDSTRADLYFGDKIKDGQCTFFVYDANGVVQKTTIDLGPTDSLQDVVDRVNGNVNNLNASIDEGRLVLSAEDGHSFAFGDDSSGVMAALGMNTLFDGERAVDININHNIISDPGYINTNHVNGAGEYNVGDNKTAKAIAALQYNKVDFDAIGGVGSKAETLQEYYDTLVGKIGSDTAAADFNFKFEKALADELNARQEEVGGVSLNEEMGNLIRFQHNYSASAKLITTADRMFQTLLSLKN